MRWSQRTVLAATMLSIASSAPAADLRFSGFGDIVLGAIQGRTANPESQLLFDAYGADPDPLNTNRGFGLTGTDFVVIADMTDDLTFLGELNLQTGRGISGSIDLDVERFFASYRIAPKFNVQAGLFFTPIGFNNRFLYARAWLMNSIQVPDFYEEELNLVPTHTIGLAVHGDFSFSNGHRLSYVVSAGNGRAETPDGAVYARDPSQAKALTGLVEWIVPGFKESRVGFSGWTDRIETSRVPAFGDMVSPADAVPLREREDGIDAYVVLNSRRASLNAEYVRAWQKDEDNPGTPDYVVSGGMAELSFHFLKGRLHPYLRYDWTSVPEGGGEYLSLREDGGQLTKVYVPEFEALMTGAAFDLNSHSRIKAEVARHFDGPRPLYAVAFQLAFGF